MAKYSQIIEILPLMLKCKVCGNLFKRKEMDEYRARFNEYCCIEHLSNENKEFLIEQANKKALLNEKQAKKF